jgi:uncharacterized membrane protein
MSDQVRGKLSKALSAVLIFAVIGAIIAFVFVVNEEPREKFTEFYILNSAGKASDYPSVLKVGVPTEVILGIVNREQATVSYEVEIRVNGEKYSELGPIVLEHRDKYEQPVSFIVGGPRGRQKVEFLLYRQGQDEVYESVYLLFDVES